MQWAFSSLPRQDEYHSRVPEEAPSPKRLHCTQNGPPEPFRAWPSSNSQPGGWPALPEQPGCQGQPPLTRAGWRLCSCSTHPLLHVGTLLLCRRPVPVNVLLPKPPDLLPSLVGEEADDAKQDHQEEAADDGDSLGEVRNRGRQLHPFQVSLPSPKFLRAKRGSLPPSEETLGWCSGSPRMSEGLPLLKNISTDGRSRASRCLLADLPQSPQYAPPPFIWGAALGGWDTSLCITPTEPSEISGHKKSTKPG